MLCLTIVYKVFSVLRVSGKRLAAVNCDVYYAYVWLSAVRCIYVLNYFYGCYEDLQQLLTRSVHCR